MKFIVDVKDVSYGTVEVEADSVEQAEEKAQDMYFSGQINWEEADVSYEARPKERAVNSIQNDALRAELAELEAFIQGTEMARDYGEQLPEGDNERYETAIARRAQIEAMLRANEKLENEQPVPKERGDSL